MTNFYVWIKCEKSLFNLQDFFIGYLKLLEQCLQLNIVLWLEANVARNRNFQFAYIKTSSFHEVDKIWWKMLKRWSIYLAIRKHSNYFRTNI